MALTKISRSLLDTGVSDSSDATAITIDSSERIGIGTTSPVATLQVKTQADGNLAFQNSTSVTGGVKLNCFNDAANASSPFEIDGSTLQFNIGSTEKMRIDSAGRVMIGTTTEGQADADDLTVANASGNVGISLRTTTAGYASIYFSDATSGGAEASGAVQYKHDDNFLRFTTAESERMRIDSSGSLLIGKTSDVFSSTGARISSSGTMTLTADANELMNINRLNDNGPLLYFSQDSSIEGYINVSGSSVTLVGFSGAHESSGISSDTAIGTVCSTIDELDTYISGTKEGQTRADHAKIKVSDTSGDSRVYGVLERYDDNNKPVVASVGIGSVRVTGACNGGDLLESNGDGTAKVQDDDIIRSKTIGKVTIGNSNTDVKLVACVLYCG